MWALYAFLMTSAGLLDPMGLAWALTGLIQVACRFRTACALYAFLMTSAGLLDPMGLAWALTGLIQVACRFRTASMTDRMGLSKPVRQPDPYGTCMCTLRNL